MKYGTPEGFKQALETRIRSHARTRMIGIARLRQILVFDRFLARVFGVLAESVIVKGGAVLELRLERARTTRDIDLRVMGSPDALSDALVRAATLDLGDHFGFKVELDREHPEIEGEGMVYQGRRFRAEARLAGKIYGFGDVLTEAPEILDGSDFFAFAGVPRACYRVYPREAHIAEKLHAYTLPRKRPNTRMKDLPDLALLAKTGPFEAVALRRALDATFSFRRTHALPARVPDPPEPWRQPFRELAAIDDLPWRDLDAVLAAARAFLDPVLAAGVGRWDPEAQRWT